MLCYRGVKDVPLLEAILLLPLLVGRGMVFGFIEFDLGSELAEGVAGATGVPGLVAGTETGTAVGGCNALSRWSVLIGNLVLRMTLPLVCVTKYVAEKFQPAR